MDRNNQQKTEKLIIFTRYPEAGKTKTRLIPALGAEGAAQLHAKLLQITLKQAQILTETRSVQVQIYYTGSTQELMAKIVPQQFPCQPQTSGDLGTRISHAIETNFRAGEQRIIIIGTDCPELNSHRLNQAFEILKTCDLILGPALDGGYYLIGLTQPIPQLFHEITWGTDQVLKQTLTIAESLQVSYQLLEKLQDIDQPEDLAALESILLR